MREKIISYLGFAKKSRNLITGFNTCEMALNKKKVKLLIIAEDLSENTKKKAISLAQSKNAKFRVYGTAEQLSKATGSQSRGMFAVIDENFAKVILEEIDKNE